jgi:hypothetical protein
VRRMAARGPRRQAEDLQLSHPVQIKAVRVIREGADPVAGLEPITPADHDPFWIEILARVRGPYHT